jgi:hypothetical protein
MKLMVMGYARHGKDTVGEMLKRIYGMRFESSSMACVEKIMLPAFNAIGLQYLSAEACYEDRVNHRAFWFECIRKFSYKDETRLGRLIFETNDVYCGIRNKEEFFACKAAKVFDYSIWVTRMKVLKAEDEASCTVDPTMADFILDNNGSLLQTEFGLYQLMRFLQDRHDFSTRTAEH